jgi:hypothetical protein
VILKITDDTGSQFFEVWGLPLTFLISVGVYAAALTMSKPGWFSMDRPYDPLDEVDDAWEARIRCHSCDKSYVAREMDRDPAAGHQAICAACATGAHFHAAAHREHAEALRA